MTSFFIRLFSKLKRRTEPTNKFPTGVELGEKPIAILGGSFDPIHHGHLKLAEIVTHYIQSAEIYFVPCGNPVHRAPAQVSANDRVNMIKLAIKNHPHWHVDTYEIDRSEPSYTLATLQHFRQRFPEACIGFIMGMDSFLKIETWGHWQELLNYAHLLIIPRQNYNSADLKQFSKEKNLFFEKKQGNIIMLPVTPPSISSTEVRKKLATQHDISSLIPKAVYDYIQQKKLYLN